MAGKNGRTIVSELMGMVQVALEQFGLTYGPRAKRHWFLWE